MKILVSGSSGLVGSALVEFLRADEHEVVRLVRATADAGKETILWDPSAESIPTEGLAGFAAVVHLAGEGIAAGRWNAAKKARIRDSRVRGTRLLSETLAGLESPPEVLVCASAVGFYGDRGEELLDEESSPGNSFLADVCRQWEAATASASKKGIRVVCLRFGMILSSSGGALAKMLLPFKLGLGGRVGSGSQYYSWIDIDDAVAAIHHAVITDALRGPVNAVSPHPVTNLEFTKTLGSVLRRPTIFPVPAFAARLALGEMADGLLLAGARVMPKLLTESGFEFRHPDLQGCLEHLLEK